MVIWTAEGTHCTHREQNQVVTALVARFIPEATKHIFVKLSSTARPYLNVASNRAVLLCHVGAKWESRYSFYSFLTSALDGVSGQRHTQTGLYPRERTPDTRWTGGWVGLRAGLDTGAIGEILSLGRRSKLGRPVCSQTLCWLKTLPGIT
jgi:hypothetical protein